MPRACAAVATFLVRKSSSTVGFFPSAFDPEAKIPTGFDVVVVGLCLELEPLLDARKVEADTADEG